MKNVLLASVLVFGVAAFANESEMPASHDEAPATQEEQAPAPEASAAKAKKAAKHGHKKADKKKHGEGH